MATDGRCARVPWTDIIKNAMGFIDSEYLPDYDTLDSDPSHLSMPKVKKLLRYWFDRQKSGQITFRFHHVLEGSERVPAKEPKTTSSKEVPKGRGHLKPTRVTKRKGNCSKKGKAPSREIISDSGEEFDFEPVEEIPFSDDDANPIPYVGNSESTPAATVQLASGTTEDHPPDWRKAPANLSESEIDVWNKFTKNLPESCSNWTHDQAMIQFQVFKGWSANFLSPKKEIHLTKQDVPDVSVSSKTPVHSTDIPGHIRAIPNVGSADSLQDDPIPKGLGIARNDSRGLDTGNPDITPQDDSIAKGLGITIDKSEDVGALTPTANPPQSLGMDMAPVPKAPGNRREEPRSDDKELGMVDAGRNGLAAETQDDLRMPDSPRLAEIPRGPRTPPNRGEQPRSKNGKFVKSLNNSKEPSNTNKRVQEDQAEALADIVATKQPSLKKAKLDETSTHPTKRGRSSKNADKSTEPGFSAPVTRSKAKCCKTRR